MAWEARVLQRAASCPPAEPPPLLTRPCRSCACTPAAALKLVGESFPWGPGSTFAYLRDNHNSVLGIRQLAAAGGAACTAAVELAAAPARRDEPGGGGGGGGGGGSSWLLRPCSTPAAAGLAAAAATAEAACSGSSSSSGGGGGGEPPHHLFAFPLESNFSGVRYDPRLVSAVQHGAVQWEALADSQASGGGGDGAAAASVAGGARALPAGRWRVLLDAAKACASTPPDLAACPADFAVLSYYKVFGYPTGKETTPLGLLVN